MNEMNDGIDTGTAGPRAKLGHAEENGRIADDGITPAQDEMLRALASVVVDEWMSMRSKGVTPAEIERLYTQEIPAIPAIPKRKCRQGKEIS